MGIDNKVKNPCIHVCTKDENGVCISCYRNKEEIKSWYKFSDKQKQDILDKTDIRRTTADKASFYI